MPHRTARLVKNSKHWRDKLRARIRTAVDTARHQHAPGSTPFVVAYRDTSDRVGQLGLYLGIDPTTQRKQVLTLSGETWEVKPGHLWFLTERQTRDLRGVEPFFPPGYHACAAQRTADAICALIEGHDAAHAGVTLADEVVRW